MPLTPEQKAANDKLHDDIQSIVDLYRTAHVEDGANEDHGVVVDWVVIIQTQGFDADGDTESGYYMAFSNGEMPDHRAIGLFAMGTQMIHEGGAH